MSELILKKTKLREVAPTLELSLHHLRIGVPHLQGIVASYHYSVVAEILPH